MHRTSRKSLKIAALLLCGLFAVGTAAAQDDPEVGRRIDEYCDAGKLDVPARVSLVRRRP
mgnify:CR=1 FL=1